MLDMGLMRTSKTPTDALPWNFGGESWERDAGDEGRMKGDSSPMPCLIGEKSGLGMVELE